MSGALTLHASTVALGTPPRGVMILGASGAGKSALALRLMALGAALVADDRTLVSRRGGTLQASAPDAIAGLIEARHVGLLRVPCLAEATLALVIDLDRTETARLPARHSRVILDIEIAALHGVASGHFPAAIRQYVLHGRAGEP